MDFGVGRFLEMFEERFGRTATTLLLAIIGLGVVGFCGKLVYETVLLPALALVGAASSSKNVADFFTGNLPEATQVILLF
jgi:hypothetical protein